MRALSLSLLLVLAAAPAVAAPRVTGKIRKAVDAWLRAEGDEEAQALENALDAIGDDVEVAADALRTHEPLSDLRRGTHHGLGFTSGGREWEYSIRLPKGYDGEERYPVLVLPDHGAVGAEAGISFWEQSRDVEKVILFRPVIVKHKGDTTRFPDQQFFAVDQAIAEVMRDAVRHLRLHYAVDHDRLFLTGLSQAGYYSWYYGVSFPDEFAAVIPESAGGMAVRAAITHLARNLTGLSVRILHTEGDQITPYADAKRMAQAIEGAGGTVDLVTYTDADYGGNVFPKRHPGPHHLRLVNVFSFGLAARREIPSKFTRAIRYRQQGREGRFLVEPPAAIGAPRVLSFSEEDGVLECDGEGAVYLVPPEAVAERKTYRVGRQRVRPEADLMLLLTDFKAHGDPARMAAAKIDLAE